MGGFLVRSLSLLLCFSHKNAIFQNLQTLPSSVSFISLSNLSTLRLSPLSSPVLPTLTSPFLALQCGGQIDRGSL